MKEVGRSRKGTENEMNLLVSIHAPRSFNKYRAAIPVDNFLALNFSK